MRRPAWIAATAVLLSLASASTASAVLGAHSRVFINELHYDNDGADAGEAVEVVAPAGTSLEGYALALYNGATGARYATRALDGTVGASEAVSEATPGLQNGAPDGVALVGPGGALIQLLSYEGAFRATDGPAADRTSMDIGQSEGPTEALGTSLQLTGDGTTAGDFTWQNSRP